MIKSASQNLLESAVVTLTTGAADADFPLSRLYDRNIGRNFKGSAATTTVIQADQSTPNLVSNPGFETGDFTGWRQNNSTIDNVVVNSGIYSSELIAVGAAIAGANHETIVIDETKSYRVSGYLNCTAHAAGIYRAVV